jgi:type I restriction enzyme S subunit
MKYKFDDIAINSTAKKQPTEADRANYIGLENIDPDSFIVENYGSDITPKGEKLLMKKGDVLFGKRRAYQRKVAIAPCDGIFSAHGMVLRPKENIIDKGYFPFFIHSDQFLNEAVRISVGGLSPTINWKDLKVVEFSLPPLSVQRELSKKLWAAYRLKESYKRLLKATDEMVEAEFRKRFGDPVKNDRQWPTMKIQDVAPESPSKISQEGDVWILNLDMVESNTGKVIGKIYDDVSNLKSVAPFDEGNVLFSKLRPNLNKVVVPDSKGYATTELVPLRPDKNKLNRNFLSSLLRCRSFVNYSIKHSPGTKMPRISMDVFRDFKCILPPLKEQESFEAFSLSAEQTKSSLRSSISSIDKVIKSLINN